MDKYFYTPDVCKDRIDTLFQPVLLYWTAHNSTLSNELPADTSFHRQQTQYRLQAHQSHEHILHFLTHMPIDGERYMLMLIYEKLYEEMNRVAPDEKYDCFYLAEKFVEILHSTKY